MEGGGGGGGGGDGMGMEARMGNFAVRGVERGVLLCTEDKVWTLQTTMGKKKIQHRCEVCGTNGAPGQNNTRSRKVFISNGSVED